MTDGISDATNAIGGLIGLGIVAGVASNMMNGQKRRYATKSRKKSKIKPIKFHSKKKIVKNKFLY